MNPQSLNDVKSLVGKIDTKAMGQKSTRQQPKKEITKKKTQNKKTMQKGSVEIRGGNILQQRFDETIKYHPRTQESKLVYQNYLGRIYELVQDQPQETLISIADEILSCLKSEQNDEQKKAIMQEIIGQKVPQEKFLDICNVVRNIKDYDVEQNQEYNDAIIMQDEENEQNDQDEQQYVNQEVIEEEQDEQKIQRQYQTKQQEIVKQAEQGEISSSDINAHWLQSQLAQYYDSSQVLNVEKQILQILGKKTKLQVQNGLLSLLNYQKYQLIKLLLTNKDKIYYLTKYHQSQNNNQKQTLKQEMKLKNIAFFDKKTQKAEKINNKDIYQDKNKIDEQQNLIKFKPAKEEDLLRIPKKKIDLTLHDTTDYLSKKQEYKFKLPDGAEKVQKPGYEEIIIPARKNQIKTQLVEITSLPDWMQPVFTGIKRFNPIQSKVLDHTLNTNENMLVCAPTSAGKTNIALLSILEVISNYVREDSSIDLKAFKVVYIAPMKALVSEITGNLSNKLKSLNITVKQLTGDMHLTKTQIQQTQVIVSTPEKWDIITRKAGQRIFTEKVKLLIIDEIHLLSDSRGPVLESLIARTIRQVQTTQEQLRIVGLSATLPNYKDVGLTLRVNPKKGLFYFDQSYRPIPLEQLYVGITEKKGVRKMMMINEILYEKVMERVSSQQIIIFVHSRRDTVRTAKAIKQSAFTRDQLNKILRPDSESKKILQAIAKQDTINSKDLKELLIEGIGIHHAGLSRPDRDLVQELFADRHLNILVSTATLAWGVNLPAHTVIIKGTQVYSPEQGRWVEISLQDIMQMLGRAGRPHFDTEGEGMIITGYDQIRYYLGLLNLQIPLQSQMLKALPDQLNAEIVLGTVNNLRDAVNWLSYTYLYIRMLKNPKHYSIPLQQLQEDPQLLKRRVNLIHTAASILQNNGLIHYDKKNGTFSPTFLGKISSHYYIKHSSMTIYNSNLKNNSGLIELFKIFSMSSQFQYLVVREEEKNELKKLIETVPVPIKGSLEEPSTKICALLQAYISRLPLQGYALNVDKVYVTQSASRIMRGLFEICLKRGWGQAAIKTLQLSKMIDKSMWSCLNPLRQFKQIPQYVLSRLEKKEQFSWQSFYQMNPQQIGDLTKFPKLGKILHKFVHHVPRVELDAYAQPLTRSSLKVELNVKGQFKWEDQHHGRQQGFWLFVLDCNEENILFSYYFVLKKDEMTFSIDFVVPLFEIMHPLYFIKVISDRWITTNSSLPLSFRNILLPQKFSPPTQILDLQPLPASQLPSIAKNLKISYLNQIQTQVYHSIIDTDENVFIGGAEGSGKFTLALFAMSNTLNEGKKVVLIEPMQELCKYKFHMISKLFTQYKVGKTFNELAKDTQVLLMNDIIISTPEAWEVISRRWKARKGFEKIGLFVVDGIHMLSEDKGATLEIVVSRMRSIGEVTEGQKIRIIATSSSVADYKQLSEWIGAPAQHTYNFHPSVRPNNFELIFSSHDQLIRQSRTYIMQKSLFQMVKHYNRNNIIITNSKKQTKISAIDFVTLLESQTNPKRFLKISQEQFKSLEKKISDKFLLHVLSYGIGYLYQGMNLVEKEIVQKLFEIEGINILFVDEGLKWQLQTLRAFVVAVLDSQKYSCQRNRYQDYSICQMNRFMGWSKLSQKDKQKGGQYSSSKFIILCESAKKNYYKKFLFQPYPLESTVHLHLGDALNSAIVSKTVQTKQECIDWLSWTFFYRRIIQNPNYYNLQQVSQQAISAYLSQLIENSIEYLENVKCVEVQQTEQTNQLTATNLGIICSYYSIKVETLATFVAGLNQNIKLKPLIQLISEAAELSNITYRPKEYQLLNQLLLPYSQSAKSKPQALLLLYFFRAKIPEQFTYELNQILPIVLRLVHSLVDIISSLGYLKPIILTMQLCQMLIQSMWITDSTLVQIMDKKLASIVQEKAGVKTISDFMNMEDDQRETLLKGYNIQKIANACNRYPIMNLATEIVDVDDEEVRVKVQLARDQQLQSLTVISHSYPQEKEELWWVVVGQKKSNRVLTTKRMVVKASSEIILQFEKVQGFNQYVVYALCDSYMGCDQAQQINLENFVQPQEEDQ